MDLGIKENCGIARVIGNDSKFPSNPQYVLLGSEDYDIEGNMKNNIVIPESLMQLQKFEEGNLEYANSQNVNLFDISEPLNNSKVSRETFSNWINVIRKGPIDPKNPGYGISEQELMRLIHLGISIDTDIKIKQTENILKLKKK